MKYNIAQQSYKRPLSAQYRVMAGDEVTLIAWKAEGSSLSYGLGWRAICDKMGIVDPMQVARVSGGRIVLGQRLAMAQAIPL